MPPRPISRTMRKSPSGSAGSARRPPPGPRAGAAVAARLDQVEGVEVGVEPAGEVGEAAPGISRRCGSAGLQLGPRYSWAGADSGGSSAAALGRACRSLASRPFSHDLAQPGQAAHPELFHAVERCAPCGGRPRETSALPGGAARGPRGNRRAAGPGRRPAARPVRGERPAGSATTAAPPGRGRAAPRSGRGRPRSRAPAARRGPACRGKRRSRSARFAARICRSQRDQLALARPRGSGKLRCASRNVSCTRSEASTLPWSALADLHAGQQGRGNGGTARAAARASRRRRPVHLASTLVDSHSWTQLFQQGSQG